MKKRVLTVLLSFVMVACLLPIMAMADGEHTCDYDSYGICSTCQKHNGDFTNWTAWTGEINPNDYGNNVHVYLTGDVELTTSIYITSGTTYLNLNDHLITHNNSWGAIIRVSGGKLRVYDVPSTTRYGQWVNDAYVITEYQPDGEYNTLFGGVIYGGKGSTYQSSSVVGGGILSEYGNNTLVMYGGTVAGNKASGKGGGICSFSPYTKLVGVTVVGNKSDMGGGIYNTNSASLTDCTIEYNEATIGGGVYNSADDFTLAGNTKITGNTNDSGAANNFYYAPSNTWYRLELSELTCADKSIGISLKNNSSPFASNAAAYVNKFQSDDSNYIVDVSNNELKLKLVQVPTYTITPAPTENGSFTVKVGDGEATTATAGATVTITATPANGYEVDTVAYTPDGGSATAITAEGGVYSFTMPDEAVTVSVTFRVSVLPHDHCVCGGSIDVAGHTHDITNPTWKAWNGTDAIAYTDGVAHVYLSADAERTSTLSVEYGHTLYLCLNGYTLSPDSDFVGGAITVNSGATLVLTDCGTDGTISGFTSNGVGGGVYNRGTCQMYGVTITDNTATYGGGIYNGGTCQMYGVTITNNTANKNESQNTSGGGVYSAGTLTMIDCTIEGNTVIGTSYNRGGGVYSDGTLAITDCTIRDNHAQLGCGVYVWDGIMTLSGNTKIIGNTTHNQLPNNVHLDNKKPIVINGALGADASIGIDGWFDGIYAEPDGNNVTALTEEDAAKFRCDNESYYYKELGTGENAGKLLIKEYIYVTLLPGDGSDWVEIKGKPGETCTLPPAPFTKPGYVIDHWNTSAYDYGTTYDNCDTFLFTEDLDLYVIWKPYTVSVIGDVAPYTATIAPTRNDVTFDWYKCSVVTNPITQMEVDETYPIPFGIYIEGKGWIPETYHDIATYFLVELQKNDTVTVTFSKDISVEYCAMMALDGEMMDADARQETGNVIVFTALEDGAYALVSTDAQVTATAIHTGIVLDEEPTFTGAVFSTGENGANYLVKATFTDEGQPISYDSGVFSYALQTYNVTLRDENGVAEGGTYSVNKTTASKGETVTITVAPEDTYIPLIFAYAMYMPNNGYGLTVNQVSDTTYTFEMPSHPVEVEVSFYSPALYVTWGEELHYASDLDEAFELAEELIDEDTTKHVTIKVVKDYVEPGSDIAFYNYGSVTIDLNGHQVYFEDTFWNGSGSYQDEVGAIWIYQEDGELFLTDSSEGKSGFIHAMLEVMYGSLRIDSGKYYGVVFPADTKISGGTFLGMPQDVIDMAPGSLYETWIGSISAFPASVYMPSYDTEESARAAMTGIVADGYGATNEIVASKSPSGCWLAGFPANTSVVKAYTVTWLNADGTTVLESKEWVYGETPVYTGETPTKAADAQYTYTFKGWTPAIEAVTGNATYTATYTATQIGYLVVSETTVHGTAKANCNYATRGSTVTVTVTADKGYVLDKLTVTDHFGGKVDVTKMDGKYTFKMPAARVMIKVIFKEEIAFSNPFEDVFTDNYYHDAVMWAFKEGITNGTTATTFSPNGHCTRAQMVTFLWRAAGCPEPMEETCIFTDVAEDAYYAKAVQWAYEQKITNGTSATTFSPDAECSRAQMATFLWRIAGSEVAESSTSQFTDVTAEKYYAVAVQWAYEQMITNGTTATTFSPDDPCTRAQMVTFLYRYYVK